MIFINEENYRYAISHTVLTCDNYHGGKTPFGFLLPFDWLQLPATA